jgi:hypothetical protein
MGEREEISMQLTAKIKNQTFTNNTEHASSSGKQLELRYCRRSLEAWKARQ